MKRKSLELPIIEIDKVHDDTFEVTYYELYLNGIYIRRYSSIGELTKYLSLMIKNEANSTEV